MQLSAPGDLPGAAVAIETGAVTVQFHTAKVDSGLYAIVVNGIDVGDIERVEGARGTSSMWQAVIGEWESRLCNFKREAREEAMRFILIDPQTVITQSLARQATADAQNEAQREVAEEIEVADPDPMLPVILDETDRLRFAYLAWGELHARLCAAGELATQLAQDSNTFMLFDKRREILRTINIELAALAAVLDRESPIAVAGARGTRVIA